jgi:FkbM family methyltransferase
MSTLQMVDVDGDLSFWAPSEREARWVYEEIFQQDCYAGMRLPDDAFIVDVGANIGLFSYFIRRQLPAARILAFEPMPETAAALRLNAARHGFGDAHIEQCALGADREERVEFTYFPHLPGNSTRYPHEKALQKSVMLRLEPPDDVHREHTGHTVTAEVRRLSSFLRADQSVDLLKVDVEGAELDVLRGIDPEHWPLIGQVVLEVQDLDGRLRKICDLLASRGFATDVRPAPMIPAEIRHFMVRGTRRARP